MAAPRAEAPRPRTRAARTLDRRRRPRTRELLQTPGQQTRAHKRPPRTRAARTLETPAACEGVCFKWLPVNPTGASSKPPHVYTYDDCNHWGLNAGSCPEDFSCGEVETVWSSADVITRQPWCSADGDTQRLEFSLLSGPTVHVKLRFTINGEPWSGAGSAQAGALHLSSRGSVIPIQVDAPSGADGVAELDLPTGEYTGYWQAVVGDDYPSEYREFELSVEGAGEAEIAFEAAYLSWSVTLDGVPYSVAATDYFLSVAELRDAYQATYQYLSAGQGAQARWAVWPGSVHLEATRVAALGLTGVSEEVELAAGDDRSLVVDLVTAELSGTVTVDGAADVDGTAVLVDAEGRSYELAVSGGAFSGRVSPGEYFACFEAAHGSLGCGVMAESVLAPGQIDAVLSTTAVSGRITVNGAGYSASGARVRSYNRRHSGDAGVIEVDDNGDFSATVYQQAHDIYMIGDGISTPLSSSAIAIGWEPSAAPIAWDLPAYPLDLSITLDGAPMETTGVSVHLWRVTEEGRLLKDPRDQKGLWGSSLSFTGDTAAGSALVSGGRWRADLSADQGTDGLNGSLSLEPFTVSAATHKLWAVETAQVTVRLQLDGQRWPAGDGAQLRMFGRSYSLPSSGEAEVSGQPLRGVRSTIDMSCSGADGCAGRGFGGVTLLSATRF